MRTPLSYVEIADDVQRRIESHEYQTGTAIPSYSGLARLHGVSVATAQRAVALLRDRGLVVGQQGRGVFVP